jgi:acetolactate synthase small subunit
MTKALDAVEFGLPMDTTISQPTPSRLFGPNHPARRSRFNPSNISSSESKSDDENIYAPSMPVSASQHALEQLGESLKKLISALEYTPETCAVDPIPLRKQRAIVKVQKEDLQDDEILSLINQFQADVKIADSYLAIERDGVRKLFLASYLKK